MNGWSIDGNVFVKNICDYLIVVQENISSSKLEFYKVKNPYSNYTVPLYKEDSSIKRKVNVTLSNTKGKKHTVTYDTFEEAFKFIDNLNSSFHFNDAVEEYFKEVGQSGVISNVQSQQ